jgi:hypothetical protein
MLASFAMKTWQLHLVCLRLSQCPMWQAWPQNYPKNPNLLMEKTTMLDLQEYENEVIAKHCLQQEQLNNLLPIIKSAGAAVVKKLALFEKYDGKVRAVVIQHYNNIELRVILAKTKPQRANLARLTASYQISCGRLRIEMHEKPDTSIKTEPEAIADHFVEWYAYRIKENLRLLLPF